ncbi:MAG: sigma-70 family RNA polymerase sigma factor [Lachnospiraceae bacterium]|nr:sigma-70 family RNA polymerase sigma factor [Lachnospiraceae bacterium]MCD7765759.1 sigma-70 family RNA polymerase sigma factor [Lachnospiraceae bacterium]MCD8398813.1 sigma-70 family RNA polymerase sigma factor [Lachnospiraceae bacterium]
MRYTEIKEYPAGLLEAVGKYVHHELKLQTGQDLSDDQMQGLDMVLHQLKERERIALLYRYKDRMTYREIGQKYGVTRSRIEQMLSKCLRKLAHPSRWGYVVRGYQGQTEYLKAVKKEDENCS